MNEVEPPGQHPGAFPSDLGKDGPSACQHSVRVACVLPWKHEGPCRATPETLPQPSVHAPLVREIAERHDRVSKLLWGPGALPGMILGPMDSERAHADRGALLSLLTPEQRGELKASAPPEWDGTYVDDETGRSHKMVPWNDPHPDTETSLAQYVNWTHKESRVLREYQDLLARAAQNGGPSHE